MKFDSENISTNNETYFLNADHLTMEGATGSSMLEYPAVSLVIGVVRDLIRSLKLFFMNSIAFINTLLQMTTVRNDVDVIDNTFVEFENLIPEITPLQKEDHDLPSPLDQRKLVKTVNAELDISVEQDVVSTLRPQYKFNVLYQKAAELAQEIRVFGSVLLEAMEEKDEEEIVLLRNSLEVKVLNQMQELKVLQIDESKEQIKVLNYTRALIEEKNQYYQNIESISLNSQLNPNKLVDSQGFQFKDQLGRDNRKLQKTSFKYELEHIDRQIVEAKITKERNEKGLINYNIQIKNNEKMIGSKRCKYTSKNLYQRMIEDITNMYQKSYQLAYDMAKKVERSYQYEFGNTDTFIGFNYWDNIEKGVLASNQLVCDIKLMETGFLGNNEGEYELEKQVSLNMLDSLVIIKLKDTGYCDFEIPEALYDMDHPGHYFRRIKSVSISIPCITESDASVSGTLSLVSNKYRKKTNQLQGAASDLEAYQEEPGNDNRFTYNVGVIQSVATSNKQSDKGVFELNFKDERFSPFEGTGAISSWRFELSSEMKQFDYNTIKDVVVHIKYTAKEGGSILRDLAETTLSEKTNLITQEL